MYEPSLKNPQRKQTIKFFIQILPAFPYPEKGSAMRPHPQTLQHGAAKHANGRLCQPRP